MSDNVIFAIIDTATFQKALTALDQKLLFEIIAEDSMDTLRYSLCGDEFIIKTTSLSGAEYLEQRAAEEGIIYTEYNHSTLLTVISSSAWNPPTNI